MTKTNLKILDWDSKHFGRKIASLDNAFDRESLQESLFQAENQKLDCVCCLLAVHEIPKVHLLESAGFRLVDIRLTFSKSLNHPLKETSLFQKATVAEHGSLLQICRTLFTDSRFFSDTNFDKTKAHAMYEAWLWKNLSSEYPVFVSQKNGRVQGFISTERSQKTGKIGLIAVDPSAQGQGLGHKLVEEACFYFQSVGCDTCEVVTQAKNKEAVRLYERAGFQCSRIELWFHKWFQNKMRVAA